MKKRSKRKIEKKILTFDRLFLKYPRALSSSRVKRKRIDPCTLDTPSPKMLELELRTGYEPWPVEARAGSKGRVARDSQRRRRLLVFSQERLEYPPFSHPTGITPGFLKTLLNVFNFAESVCMRAMLDKWRGLALPDKTLFQLMLVGKLLDEEKCNFYKFLAIACGFLGKVRNNKKERKKKGETLSFP